MQTKDTFNLDPTPFLPASPTPVLWASLIIACGVLAFITPLFTQDGVAISLSCLLQLSGVAQLLYIASVNGAIGGATYTVLQAGLSVGAGLWLQMLHLSNMAGMVLLLPLFFVVESAIEPLAYFSSSKDHRSRWAILTPLTICLLAIVICIMWPTNSNYSISIVVGTRMSVMGFARLLWGLKHVPNTDREKGHRF